MTNIQDEVVFSYPATVSDITYDVDGNPTQVRVWVSIDGKDMSLSCKPEVFNFPIKEDMRIMADGIKCDGKRSLRFREIRSWKLDREHEEMLRRIVASLKPI